MARRILFQNVMKNATDQLEAYGPDSSEFQGWYSETAKHLDLKQKAILDAFIDAWRAEHPQLWAPVKGRSAWRLVVQGVTLVIIERQRASFEVSGTLFELSDFRVELLDVANMDDDDSEAYEAEVVEKLAKLQTRIEAYVYTRLSEILDVLGKVTTGVN